MALSRAGVLEQMVFKGLSNPNHSVTDDSIIKLDSHLCGCYRSTATVQLAQLGLNGAVRQLVE